MKYFLTIISLSLFTLSAWAQPVNDECSDAIDLGTAPVCTDDIFTNVDATNSIIVGDNSPSCFNAGIAQTDVFFTFTPTSGNTDLTIVVSGTNLGPNGVSIVNPQIAIYRGDCVGGLLELYCVSAGAIGNTTIRLDALGLTANVPYFIRINDVTDSSTPNWGDFQLCVEEYVPPVIMGEQATSNACFGTLLDSGGADDDYSNDENNTFTLCPDDATTCIEMDVAAFNIAGADVLNVYAGEDTDALQIASLAGVDNGNNFSILASSDCVTFEFITDATVTSQGFEISWQCSATACGGSSFDNPTVISGVPYINNNLTTCGGGATFNQTPCNSAFFLNGPEQVFEYTSDGGYCASVTIIDAEAGTGVTVLNGPPDDPATLCLASAADGSISNVSFETPGVYYIVVANPFGCTDFSLNIVETECTLSPALVDALCNPLNGCLEAQMVSEFTFEQGFQDIPLTNDVNDGCWGGVGAESDYIWFSIQAADDGAFGFILEGTNFPSDIDFNVWGPFTVEEVCETPQVVIDAATNTQPIRSSYAGGPEPTGLADIHPGDGSIVEDVYDCQGNNDDIVQTIAAQEGEVYIVLANDWGNDIEDGNVSIDWSPSDPQVLDPVSPLGGTIEANDTSVCAGQPVLIEVITGVNNIEWIGDHIDELSCTDCFTPIATPAETRVYQAVLDLTCYFDTIDVTINVFDLDAGPDQTFCLGEEFQIPAGQDFETATYEWSPPVGLDFDCTDCATPIVTAQAPGVYQVPVTLTAEDCNFTDMITITVLNSPAPEYIIAEDQQICAGESVALGGSPTVDHAYSWSSVPDGDAIPAVANPLVAPTTTTTYYLDVTNAGCPVTSTDSVTIAVVQLPLVDIVESQDTVCNLDTISLQNTILEEDVLYTWSGPDEIFTPDSIYTEVMPNVTGTYTLTADRMGCTSEATIDIDVIRINVELQQPDTTLLCLGDSVVVSPFIEPVDAEIQWNQPDITVNNPVLMPSTNTTYIATVQNGICILMDTFYVQVDSIPMDMTITADPEQDTYCQGDLVQLTSPTYEPANYPHIEHQWEQIGMETSDTLYNFVLTAVDTFTYIRTTNSGACSAVDSITLNVVINNMEITPAMSEICEGESVDLLITADTLGTIEWMPTQGLSCTDCPNPTAAPTSSIDYTATNEVGGCPFEASASVIVINLPVIDLVDNQEGCPSSNISLNTTAAGDDVSYQWSSSEDPDFTSIEPTIVVMPGTPTTYTLEATNSCATISDNVTISEVTMPSITMPDDLTVCLGAAFSLEASVENDQNVSSLTWIYDGESEIGNPSEFIATETGTATFNVEYSGDNGESCGFVVGDVNIEVVDQLYSIAIETEPTPLDTINGGADFVLNALVDPPTGFDYTYTWLGEGVQTPDNQTTSVVAPNPDRTIPFTYTLLVSSPEGCEEEVSINVFVRSLDFEIPNIFSPNGDNTNEVFKLFTNSVPNDFSLKIFNRWGQLVFETNNPNEGWNGQLNGDGAPAPSDVYIYEMTSSAVYMPEPIRGQVTLVR